MKSLLKDIFIGLFIALLSTLIAVKVFETIVLHKLSM